MSYHYNPQTGEIRDEDGQVIATMSESATPEQAALQAAAPDLLGMLQIAGTELAGYAKAFEHCVTNPATGRVDDANDALSMEFDRDILLGIGAAIAKASAPTMQRLPADDTEGGAA